jgi:hypothetical protein
MTGDQYTQQGSNLQPSVPKVNIRNPQARSILPYFLGTFVTRNAPLGDSTISKFSTICRRMPRIL